MKLTEEMEVSMAGNPLRHDLQKIIRYSQGEWQHAPAPQPEKDQDNDEVDRDQRPGQL